MRLDAIVEVMPPQTFMAGTRPGHDVAKQESVERNEGQRVTTTVVPKLTRL
jgi:hypothetical protein